MDEATREEKKVLMHVLKDLWLGDLALGGEKNIGRGVLRGVRAEIYEQDKIIAAFEQGEKGLNFKEGNAEILNGI